jgi:hypothetical protein
MNEKQGVSAGAVWNDHVDDFFGVASAQPIDEATRADTEHPTEKGDGFKNEGWPRRTQTTYRRTARLNGLICELRNAEGEG